MNTQQEPLTREQRDILHHTVHRAAGGLYCGGGKDIVDRTSVCDRCLSMPQAETYVRDNYRKS